jgi:hypothetical protein
VSQFCYTKYNLYTRFIITVPDRSIRGQLVRPILAYEIGLVYCSHVISMCVVAVAVACDNVCARGLGTLDLASRSRAAKPNK